MPKVKISEYSATANSNTDVASINIDEGCAPSGINNAIRAIMGHLKDFQSGTNGDPFNGPVNGTVGATTPATGAFTTLSASSTVTLSGGTANGVAYLNGSKVLTTGSALVFDGTNFGINTTTPSAFGRFAIRGASTANGRNVSGHFSDASTGSIDIAHGSGYVAIDTQTAGTTFRIDQGGVTSARFTQYGIGLSTAVPSSGTGITFPATQSASSNANTLDDYEEGDWTPTQGAGLTVVGAFSSSGRYTKIGRQVFIEGVVTGGTSVAIPSVNAITISSLPFSQGFSRSPGLAGNEAISASAAFQVIGTNLYFMETMAATTNIRFSATYSV